MNDKQIGCFNHYCHITGRRSGMGTNAPCKCLLTLKDNHVNRAKVIRDLANYRAIMSTGENPNDLLESTKRDNKRRWVV